MSERLAAIADARGGVDALAGLTLAYVGDGANNMAHSYLLGGALAGMHVRIGCPATFAPDAAILADAVRLLDAIPLLRRIPGRVLGLGFGRQHVQSPLAKDFP